MPAWSAQVIIRQRGKSYTKPPIFVSVEAGTWATAAGAAAREAKKRLAGLYPRMHIEMVSIRIDRV